MEVPCEWAEAGSRSTIQMWFVSFQLSLGALLIHDQCTNYLQDTTLAEGKRGVTTLMYSDYFWHHPFALKLGRNVNEDQGIAAAPFLTNEEAHHFIRNKRQANTMQGYWDPNSANNVWGVTHAEHGTYQKLYGLPATNERLPSTTSHVQIIPKN
ncbi:uncharacterized protein [Chiloscyllium punctatum]|uniref:uncharacterized protein isoform X2 n=1 Tax=Chiloscyllium punctatum TaxID=137246 RepID=UPI003B635A08